MDDETGAFGELLSRLSQGDQAALEHALPIIYRELRDLAAAHLAGERPGHTLQPTALVHEAYLRLVEGRPISYQDRTHFLAVASRAMRQVLVDHAVRRRAIKRGGTSHRVPLEATLILFEERCFDLIALDEALEHLSGIDATQSQIVELRFFAGLSMTEVAAALNLPLRTVEREWAMARAWLRRRIGDGTAESNDGA